MKMLCVEDGSVDLDALESGELGDGKVLVYRQGSKPPFILEIPNEPKAITELKLLQKMFERDSKFNSYGSSFEISQYYYEYITKRIAELTHQQEDKGEEKYHNIDCKKKNDVIE